MRVINFGCAWNDTGLQLGLMTNITTVHDKLAPAGSGAGPGDLFWQLTELKVVLWLSHS